MKLETLAATDVGTARAFSDIQGVERAYVTHDGDLVAVTTIIDRDDNEATYDSIYDRGRSLIHEPSSASFRLQRRRSTCPPGGRHNGRRCAGVAEVLTLPTKRLRHIKATSDSEPRESTFTEIVQLNFPYYQSITAKPPSR